MARKYLRRATEKLEARRAGYDSVKNLEKKKAMKRPGSMNPHKQS